VRHANRTPGPRALLLGLATIAGSAATATAAERAEEVRPRFPDVLLVTVDTLRADHLSSSGYPRPTSPNIDALLASGFRFTVARTVEPLTNPALASLLTSVPPHVHGATRNGLPARAGLASLPRLLAKRGYRTAAFLGNWTLKDHLSGLAGHWQTYEVVTSRKRWLGLIKDEAHAEDLSAEAIDWVEELREEEPDRPFLLWVHYVEPHAPYRLHEQHAERFGIDPRHPTAIDRYDTEIAAVDAEIGRLLAELDRLAGGRDRLTVFHVDHGEAFGENGEVGHGRLLHAPTLHVPLGFAGAGRVPPGESAAAVTTLDVAPTVLSLLGLGVHPYFRGRDLVPAMNGGELAGALPCFQAHRGAVQSVHRADRARRAGLLEIGHLDGGRIEVLHVGRDDQRRAQLAAGGRGEASPRLAECVEEIRAGLAEHDRFVPPELDAETVEQLRALGYLD
jgi:arylsulfatase A-like enzyme